MSVLKAILWLLFLPLAVNAATDKEAKDKRNLTYTSARINILPLLQLKYLKEYKGKIIFVHPQKVGGTNVAFIADAEYGKFAHRFSVPRVDDISPSLITAGWIGGLANLKKQCVGENKIQCSEYKLINGHFPYGAHNYLNGQYKYIALIRNPIERELSSINFDYQRGYIKNLEEARKMLFETMLDNPQTRLIAGESYMVDNCDERVLQIAKENLARDFLLVGVTEDTNTFIQALITITGKQPVAIGRSQVTSDKIITKLSDNEYKTLTSKHKYDLELYHYAKSIWEKWKRDNIKGTVPISSTKEILTIMPDFANTHKAGVMTKDQIDEYNATYSQDEIIKIKQIHSGVERK